MNVTKEFAEKMIGKLNQIRAMFASTAEFEDYTTDEGVTLIVDGDIGLEKQARTRDAEGNEIPAPDGQYKLTSDGRTITVSGGIITEITETVAGTASAEMADAESFEEMMNLMFDLLWKMSERYNAMAQNYATIMDAQAADGAIIVQMQETLKTIGKAPAAPTKTKREPAPAPAKMAATPNLTPEQRIKIAHMERQAGEK